MMAEGKYRVSVVVPTFKRPDLLTRCLAALVEQDFDAADYEVIIVDDAACDETRQVVETWCRGRNCVPLESCGQGKQSCTQAGEERQAYRQSLSAGPIVRYVPVTGAHGPAAARNTGWRAAGGEIIAFTDDDCIPDAGWLGAGVAAFANGTVGVCGQLVVPLQHNPTDYERNAAQLATSRFVTANCFYRRTCLEAIGGFDERFTAAWREDSDLFFTLLKKCGDIEPASGLESAFVYAPDAVVIHPLRAAKWGVSLGQQRKSMFNALLYKKHPVLYRQKIQAAPPWHYYVIVGAMLAVTGGIVRGNQRMAFGAACLWMFMTGRFCLQRLEQTSRDRRHVAEMVVTSILIPPLAIFWRMRGAITFRVFFL